MELHRQIIVSQTHSVGLARCGGGRLNKEGNKSEEHDSLRKKETGVGVHHKNV